MRIFLSVSFNVEFIAGKISLGQNVYNSFCSNTYASVMIVEQNTTINGHSTRDSTSPNPTNKKSH